MDRDVLTVDVAAGVTSVGGVDSQGKAFSDRGTPPFPAYPAPTCLLGNSTFWKPCLYAAPLPVSSPARIQFPLPRGFPFSDTHLGVSQMGQGRTKLPGGSKAPKARLAAHSNAARKKVRIRFLPTRVAPAPQCILGLHRHPPRGRHRRPGPPCTSSEFERLPKVTGYCQALTPPRGMPGAVNFSHARRYDLAH